MSSVIRGIAPNRDRKLKEQKGGSIVRNFFRRAAAPSKDHARVLTVDPREPLVGLVHDPLPVRTHHGRPVPRLGHLRHHERIAIEIVVVPKW